MDLPILKMEEFERGTDRYSYNASLTSDAAAIFTHGHCLRPCGYLLPCHITGSHCCLGKLHFSLSGVTLHIFQPKPSHQMPGFTSSAVVEGFKHAPLALWLARNIVILTWIYSESTWFSLPSSLGLLY